MKKIDEYANKYLLEYGDKFKFMVYAFHFGELLRGRPFEGKIEEEVLREVKHFEDIWTPPLDKLSRGRCNDDDESRLYLVSCISSIPEELSLKEGDLMTISRFKQVEKFVNVPILGWEKLMKIGNVGLSSVIENYFENKPMDERIIDNEISNIFTTQRNAQNDDIYDHTIALSKLYFSNNPDGLMYPSVSDKYKSVNLALDPDKVRSKIVPLEVSLCRLILREQNGFGCMEILRRGVFNEDGSISWSSEESIDLCRYEI